MKKISVVIPTKNELENLKKLLPVMEVEESIGEVIVMDSPKSDDGIEKLFGNSKVRVLKSSRAGRAHQLAEGAEITTGKILFFIHADWLPPNGFVDDILESISKGNHAGCFSYRFDRDSRLLRFQASWSRNQSMFTGGGDQGLFIRKEAYEQLGGYNRDMRIMEDFDLYQRIRRGGMAFELIQNDATVSARKYNYNSFLRVNLVQGLIFLFYKMGMPQSWLCWLYGVGLRWG